MCLQKAWASYGLLIPSDENMWKIRVCAESEALWRHWTNKNIFDNVALVIKHALHLLVFSVFSAAFIFKCCNPFLVFLPWFPSLHYQVILFLSPVPHFPSGVPPDSLSWNAQSNWLCDAVKYKILPQKLSWLLYLTIILRARVGYEMIDSQLGATRLVGYNHLISNKRE